MSKSLYDADLIINTAKVSDGRNVIDLNLLALDGYIGSKGIVKRSISGVNKIFFDAHRKHYSSQLHKTAKLVAHFLIGYEPPGRRTIFNVLKEFFDFQVDQGNSIRDPSKIQDYCIFLQFRIYSREISRKNANSRLSAVNSFLLYTGDIYSDFKHSFTDKKYKKNSDAYTNKELSEIIQTCYIIFKTNAKVIKEHLERSKQGYRDFPISSVTSVEEVKLVNPSVSFDYIVKNPVYWFMHSAFVLFCFFTWSNEKQLSESELNDFILNEDGVESKLIYKGRAHKFVRLNIGESGIEGDKTGIAFFKQFIDIRLMLVEYLKKSKYILNHNALLFMTNQRDNEIRRFSPALNAFNNHPVLVYAEKKGFKVPLISSRRLRKTVEQVTDSEIKNPFVILDKAQHSWNTYRKSYAQGNQIEARKAMSLALKALTESAINEQSFDKRKKAAKQYDISIISRENSDYQINGLTCKDISGESPESERFKRQQNKYKRNPKLCANLSNCINCSNCALIEDEDPIYHLLSFQHMIDYSKPIYIGSSKASEKYSSLVSKIELMLAFIDPRVVARAKRKLQNEGVAEVWKV